MGCGQLSTFDRGRFEPTRPWGRFQPFAHSGTGQLEAEEPFRWMTATPVDWRQSKWIGHPLAAQRARRGWGFYSACELAEWSVWLYVDIVQTPPDRRT